MTAAELIAFEKLIAADFEAGKIAAPVHLAGGNEKQLIDIFAKIDKANDWVACAWRSHYHCLLKGVPPDKLLAAIHAGRSIALCFPEHKILSSAIVGGIAPIALGIAWTIKRRGANERIWCFIGDMTYRSGIVHECMEYSRRHRLPIWWVVENNGKSVCTDTEGVWGPWFSSSFTPISYEYRLTYPHVGTGKWVSF